MNTINIEKIACSAVGKYLSDCCVLVPNIDENDKTPIWDGDIYIYDSPAVCNENLLGRYPLQIKGKTVKSFSKSASFSVRVTDLKKFYQEGGCIFFVVQEKKDESIEETETQIFYNILDRHQISSLLEESDSQIHKNIQLVPILATKSLFVEELKKALYDKQQIGTLIRTDELDEIINFFTQLGDEFKVISDNDAKRAILTYVESLSSLRCTNASTWVDKVVAYMRGIIHEFEMYGDEYTIVGLYFLLGNFCASVNFSYSAERYYMIALYGCRKYAKLSPEIYLPNVANTLSNLGNFHVKMHEYKKAESELSEALRLFRNLSITQPEKYSILVASTLYNMGEFHRQIKAYEEAEKELRDSLLLIHKLQENEPNKYSYDLACTFNSLGLIHFYVAQYDKCIGELINSLSLYEHVNMDGHQIDDKIAMVFNNLGNAYCCVGDFTNAEKAYMKSLSINNRLASICPQTYNECVVENLTNLSFFYQRQSKRSKAQDAINKATALCRNLYTGNPKRYAILFNHVLHVAVSFYMSVQDHDNVKLHVDEGNDVLRIIHQLSAENQQ